MQLDTQLSSLCDRCRGTVREEQGLVLAGQWLCPECAASAQGRHAPPATYAGMPPQAVAAVAQAPQPEGLLSALLHDVNEWSRGRSWALRAPLLAYLAYVLVRHLADPMYASAVDALNLGIHEMGHLVFQPFGMFLTAAGGTILQCLAPVAALAMFLRQRDYFAISVAIAWLGTNCFDVAVYVGDARAQALPLVTVGGGEAKHDWTYLLGELGMLELDGAIELVLRVAGSGLLLASLALGAGLCWHMFRSSQAGDLR